MAERLQPAEMRWWGWGDPAQPPALGSRAIAYLRENVGISDRPRPPVALARVGLPQSRLDDVGLDRLRAIVGSGGVSCEHPIRVLHAAGKGYPDLVRMRAGTPDGAPDAVVFPRSHEQVAELLRACAAGSLAVVPFGGGTSVVGGVAPIAGEHAAVIALDTRRMAEILELDAPSRTVTVQGGMRAPALEGKLARHGLTLGHYPQSFEYVSLGGCVATRSAGQASTGYGAIDKMVVGLRLAAPAGEIELEPVPATAAGPGMRQLVVGSEGALGVLTEVSLRVRPAPSTGVYEGMFFASFAEGVEALRRLAGEHSLLPDVVRLSDERETELSLMLAEQGFVKSALTRAYMGARGVAGGCLAILGFEGSEVEVAFRRHQAKELLRRHGGRPAGSSPGQAWLRGRFAGPYLRDDLLGQGVMAETLETAAQWSRLLEVHDVVAGAISRALSGQGTPGIVMCHLSHVYETGASLYYTLLARQREGQEIAQWEAVKRAAGDAIRETGATITHHHAIGRDHARWLPGEISPAGLATLRAAKAQLDPSGIMNPGKLLGGQEPIRG
ncbi:MAG TPA: FAD-binding oxidoreductase [Gemmatimonadales bacterium]|nr:FAD-binding oxidoreductase [Gemmatimonadales bacterium]